MNFFHRSIYIFRQEFNFLKLQEVCLMWGEKLLLMLKQIKDDVPRTKKNWKDGQQLEVTLESDSYRTNYNWPSYEKYTKV